jgi:hypothetical protein
MCNCRWRHENLRAVRQTVRPKGLLDGLWFCSTANKIKISSEGQATCRLHRKSPKEYRYNESSWWNAGMTSLSPAVGRTLTNRFWASFHDENVSPFLLKLSSYSFSTGSIANLYFKITWMGYYTRIKGSWHSAEMLRIQFVFGPEPNQTSQHRTDQIRIILNKVPIPSISSLLKLWCLITFSAPKTMNSLGTVLVIHYHHHHEITGRGLSSTWIQTPGPTQKRRFPFPRYANNPITFLP